MQIEDRDTVARSILLQMIVREREIAWECLVSLGRTAMETGPKPEADFFDLAVQAAIRAGIDPDQQHTFIVELSLAYSSR